MTDRQVRYPAWLAVFSMILLMALIGSALTGCGLGPDPTPTKTPKPAATDTPLPTETATSLPEPTDTPVPTQPPIEVATATTEVATATTEVVNTPTRTPTPELTSEPTSIPTLDPNASPLTGIVVDDISKLERRPLAIKISNAPSIVRPQAGLDKADVVFEHLAEAQLTRFTAIFLSQDSDKVGSVRSARLIDLEIPAMFKSIFAFSGASGGVKLKMKESDFIDRVLSPDPGFNDPGFKRIPAEGKAYEHTLFTDTPTLWQIATERDVNQKQDLRGWTFTSTPPEGGQVATEIDIVYRANIASAEYRYNTERQAYMRYVFGDPHVDEVSGEQVIAKNVIALYANHVETDIVEDSTGPKPYYSIEIQLWGQGPAKIFRDGTVYDVTWSRPHRDDMIRFLDDVGNPFPFKPGNTWIQVVPLDFEVVTRP